MLKLVKLTDDILFAFPLLWKDALSKNKNKQRQTKLTFKAL